MKRKINPLPGREVLLEHFSYDPETGVISYKDRPAHHFVGAKFMRTTNRRFAGREAGATAKSGYIHVRVNGTRFAAHRIIWMMIYGIDPCDMDIDHINHNPSDNRLENIRMASHADNVRNVKHRKASPASGVRGVTKRGGKWAARIQFNGKQIWIGTFPTIGQAKFAADSFRKQMFGIFAGTLDAYQGAPTS